MLIKQLSSIHQVPTSHSCGLKQVLLSNEETNSKITQIAITQLKQGETAEEHCHPDMAECFFIISGNLQIKINGAIYQCLENDFIMVDCNERHELKALTDCRFMTIGCAI
jgi:mannose-6-phosphate isomerase-like protein (cupin superfamily)